jgi:hypothetical protein
LRIDAGELPDFLHETRHVREVRPARTPISTQSRLPCIQIGGGG